MKAAPIIALALFAACGKAPTAPKAKPTPDYSLLPAAVDSRPKPIPTPVYPNPAKHFFDLPIDKILETEPFKRPDSVYQYTQGADWMLELSWYRKNESCRIFVRNGITAKIIYTFHPPISTFEIEHFVKMAFPKSAITKTPRIIENSTVMTDWKADGIHVGESWEGINLELWNPVFKDYP